MNCYRQAKTLLTFLWLVTIGLLTGCASPALQFEQATAAYKQLQSPKALAVAYYPNGAILWGYSWRQPSLEEAKEVALRMCEEKGAQAGAPISCQIMYENDRFISVVSSAVTPPPTRGIEPVSKRPPTAPKPSSKTGSGIFITHDGLVLTAEHVIRGATNIEVLTPDGRRVKARVQSASRSLDLAVLTTGTSTSAYVPVRLNRPVSGTRVFTVGFPVPGVLGQEPKVSEGIINAASGIGDDAGFMQISIPVQPGNSGGPVMTEDGFLVGVITSSAAIAPFLEQTGTIPQNVNWAVHSSLAVTLLGKEGAAVQPRPREQSIAHAVRASVLVLAQDE